MKTENRHRLAAVFIVLAMLLSLVPFEAFVRTTARAEGKTYTLDLTEIYKDATANVAIADSTPLTVGDFKIYPKNNGSSNIQINQTKKTFSDGYEGTVRLNWGGGSTVDTSGNNNHKGVIEFTTTAAATVKVWWVNAGDNRQVTILDSTGTPVDTTKETLVTNDPYFSTLNVKKAGTYYLGNSSSHNYVFKVVVTEGASSGTETSTSKELDISALYGSESADVAINDPVELVDGYFTVYGKNTTGGSKFNPGQNKDFDDDSTYKGTGRINFGGKADVDKSAIKFTTSSAATVKVWWVPNGTTGQLSVFSGTKDNTVDITKYESLTTNKGYVSTLNISKAGTYYVGSTDVNIYIFKVVVTEGGSSTPVVRKDWSEVAAPEIGTITADGSKISVPVTAVVGDDGGDEVVVTMTDKDGKATTAKSIAEKDAHTVTFTATASGTYTFTAALKREGETDKTSAAKTFAFTLPLGKPVISSAMSKGNGSIEVKWSAVPEADSYKVYYSAPSVAETSKDVTGTETTITGLEVGKTYTFTVAAVRDDVEGDRSISVETDVSANEEVAPFIFESKDLTAANAGTLSGSVKAGTDDFFTLQYSSKSKIDGSSKTWDDGYASDKRVAFGGGASKAENSVAFTTTEAATVKLWWASNGYDMVVLDSDGSIVDTVGAGTKNAAYLTTFKLPEAGTYYIGSSGGGNYIFKVQVKYGTVLKHDWSAVAAPTITSAAQTVDATTKAATGTITVNVNAAVGERDADMVTVYMYDEEGDEVGSAASAREATTHAIALTPTATGTYTFKAVLSREGEDDKSTEIGTPTSFVLPIVAPDITSAYNKGSGVVEIEWTKVPEADKYNIYVDGTKKSESNTTIGTVEGLTVGSKVKITVEAVRNSPAATGPKSAEREVTVTTEAQSKWSNIFYGTSTSKDHNTVSGDINENKVTLTAKSNGGKIIPGSSEGVTYYYTAIPSDKNFIFRAKIHLDSWTYNNGQEGFGMIALDSLPDNPNTTEVHWTNQYLLGAQKVEYRWDSETNSFADYSNADYPKYSMSLGIGALVKSGITAANLDAVKAALDTTLIGAVAPKEQIPMENSATSVAAGNYNIVGGLTAAIPADKNISTIGTLTDFDLEIRKNNTGYFLTYYDASGNIIGQKKFYEPGELSVLDEDNVYVGFFTARNAVISINKSDLTLEIIDPADDAPAEERPITYVTPKLSITSASVSNSKIYNLMLNSNVNGTVEISVNGIPVISNVQITGGKMLTQEVELPRAGTTSITAVLTPASNEGQNLPAYTEVANTDPVSASVNVRYVTMYAEQDKIYVAPDVSGGYGTVESPLDIYTAVQVAQPGQTIVLMEGTYNLTSPLRIERGIDGTADKPIKMIADPEAATRPVFDFTDSSEGIRLGGSYWHMYGFDVTNSNGTGMRVCGNYNTVELLELYGNGNTGLQISAFRDSNDPVELRPKYNTILNCTSYNNADPTGEDADGFAAKLTVGEGNVFDGCVAHHNTDDGWDLYARVSSGAIGAVTIKNCVAYENGHNLAGTISGNGNGFKLGGENLPAGHTIVNSVSFNNDADGITSNSCPDVRVINCTSYGNGKTGLNLYTNNTSNTTNYTAQNVVVGGGSTVKKNKTDTSTVENVKAASAGDFVSTEFEGFVRKADGTVDLGDFLKLKNASVGGADLDKDIAVPAPGTSSGSGSGSGSTLTPATPVTPAPDGNNSGTDDNNTSGDKTDKNATEFKDEENKTDITVTAPEGAFDNAEDVKFNANPVPEETNDEEFTFDLFFTNKDGSKVQPKVSVTVKIPVPEALKNKDIFVYHVESDGKYTEIDCKFENGMVVFTATSFSKYIITSKKLAAATTDSNTSADNNSSGSTSNGGSTNPSTSATIPMIRFVAFSASAAALCIFRRKRS